MKQHKKLQLEKSLEPIVQCILVKFIYSEKATKCCEISTVNLSYVVPVKSAVEIQQNFVGFSEYMNFKQMSYEINCNLLNNRSLIYLKSLQIYFRFCANNCNKLTALLGFPPFKSLKILNLFYGPTTYILFIDFE